jgi:hypothetical protein
MGLRDVTGVLSRYVVLGYYVPAFFTLAAMSQLFTSRLQPRAFEELGTQDRFLVLGALALVLGLALVGLRYPLTRLLEGYPLELGPGRRLRRPFLWLQRRSYDRLAAMRDDKERTGAERTWAARVLDRRFHRDRDRILATRFGNAFRATENYSFTRWGLDGVAAWPRIEPLLNEQERELHTNAESDLAFFVNAALGAFATGVLMLVDGLAGEFVHPWWAYVVPFAVAYAIYRASIGAAERLGTERRASIDLHRRELYGLLGVRAPASFSDERDRVALAVSRALLYAKPISDDLALTSKPQPRKEG